MVEKKCPRGQILRKGYTRKAYKRGGKLIKATKIKPACIKDRGAKGKTPSSKKVLPKLEKGSLSKYGLPPFAKVTNRDCVFTGVVARESGDEPYSSLSKKFIVISNYNKNQNPELQKKIGRCRKFALVGFNAEKIPGGKVGRFTKKDFELAKSLTKEVEREAKAFAKASKKKK